MKGTQKEKIHEYMKRYGSITPVDAMREFSCMRLGARIWDLKADGVLIRKETEHALNKFGDKVSYARYSLVTQ